MVSKRLRRDLFPLEPLQLVFDESYDILRQLNQCGHEIDLRIFVMLRFAGRSAATSAGAWANRLRNWTGC